MAYTYLHTHTCMISHTQECTDELPHTYVYTSVYTKIQEDICRLQEWSDMWSLYFNVTKCKATHIGRKKKEAVYKMKVNEDEYRSIAKHNEEKDLGVIFDESFFFDVHLQSVSHLAKGLDPKCVVVWVKVQSLS